MSRRILVVEDDPETRDYLAKGLREAGYAVEATASGRQGLMLALDGGFDALILDRMLPDLDGLSLLKSLRAAGVAAPAILLTAMSAIDERVSGLRAGADDYVVKPFSFAELSARLEAILRRPAEVQPEQTRLTCADLELDLIARTARRGDRRIELLPREFQMLEYLMRREGRVVTRTMLLEGLWDYRFDPGTNVIDVHISRLRRKIDARGRAAADPHRARCRLQARRDGLSMFRSATTRLILVHLALLAVLTGLVLGSLYWRVGGVIDAEQRAVVETEVRGFTDDYARGGIPALAVAIDRRLASPTDRDAVYLLAPATGDRIAGNLGRWPPTVAPDTGWATLRLYRTDRDRATDISALALRLPGGELLLVGRDVAARALFDRTLVRAAGLGAGRDRAPRRSPPAGSWRG